MKHSAGAMVLVWLAAWGGTRVWGEDLEALVEETNKTRRALAMDAMKAVPATEKVTDLSTMIEQLDACEAPKRRAQGAWGAEAKETVPAAALEEALAGAPSTPNDVALAWALHREGLYAQAEEIYKRAKEKSKDDEAQQAWLLLMIGDCQMRTDAEAASATYKQFAERYVNSPWRSFAMFRAKLLLWQFSDPLASELAQKEKK